MIKVLRKASRLQVGDRLLATFDTPESKTATDLIRNKVRNRTPKVVKLIPSDGEMIQIWFTPEDSIRNYDMTLFEDDVVLVEADISND